MINKLKLAVKKILRRKASSSVYDPKGKDYYDPNSKMNFQDYFIQNREAIFKGDVPSRYIEIAEMIPGNRILEIGSADGTQALVLAEQKETVLGLELMPEQHESSLQLKDAWLKLGKSVENCHLYNGDAKRNSELFSKVDTVYMSRVIYHLRDDIFPLFQRIEDSSNIKHLVLVGCPNRERKWLEHGETGDIMGKYAYYASLQGMKDLVTKHGFQVMSSVASSEGRDPVVVASRV